MDISKLAKALTLSIDEKERKAKESYLAEMKVLDNFCPALLEISCKEEGEAALVAAIQLKNHIENNWKYGQDQKLNDQLRFDKDEEVIPISAIDKNYIRVNILPALFYSINKGDTKLMKQFNQVIKKIAKYDFEMWKEDFMSKVIEFFNSNDEKGVLTGINSFSQISKIFEFESGQYKESYKKAFEILSPIFLAILSRTETFLGSENGYIIIYKIYKIFFRSIQLDICPIILIEKNFESWNFSFIKSLNFPTPAEYSTKTEKPDEADDFSKSIYWKLKKISLMIIYRIYQKYGYIETVEAGKTYMKDFANLISTTYLPHYFNTCISLLEKSKENFVSEYVLSLIYKFFSQMMSRFHLIESLEIKLPSILSEFIVQNAMMTIKDIDSFVNDTKNYIHKQFDITESYYILRYSVCQFVRSLVTFKKKDSNGKILKKQPPPYYQDVFKYFVSIMQQYEDQVRLGNTPDPRIKESVIYLIQSIASSVIKRSNGEISGLVVNFILKEFDSNIAFLRERACTFFESFEDQKWAENELELIHEVTRKICNILDTESQLPVRVMAAISAPILLKNKGVKEMLSPHVPKLLEIYLNLINTIDLEEILSGLEVIVARFNNQLKDYAVALTFELVKIFKRLSQQDDEEKGDSLLVLEGVLRTLMKIIELFCNNTEIFPQIEGEIHNIIIWGLQPENFEKLDDTLDIISSIVRKSEILTPATWSYFPEIIFSLIGTEEEQLEYKTNYPGHGEYEGLGFENISDNIPILCHYIVKDPENFINFVDKKNVKFLDRIFQLVQRIILICKSKKLFQNVKYALKLLNVVIESLKGKIDVILVPILNFLISELKENPKQSYKIALIESISDCFYYNPSIAITTTDNAGFIEALFKTWLTQIHNFSLESEMKRSLMGLTAILTIDPKEQNKLIIQNMKSILDSIFSLASTLDQKKEKKLTKGAKDLDGEEYDEQDDDVTREEQLNDYLKKAQESTMGQGAEEEDLFEDDEDDEEWDEFVDLNNMTLFDKIDEILFIRGAFEYISHSNSSYYQDLMSLLDSETRMKLETYVKNAEARAILRGDPKK